MDTVGGSFSLLGSDILVQRKPTHIPFGSIQDRFDWR